MSKQAGFVLITVMWLLLVLSGIAIGVAALIRTDTHLTANMVDEAKARHLAQAAIFRTILTLMTPKNLDAYAVDGYAPRRLDVLGSAVQVRVTDECAKVDINAGWGLLVSGIVEKASEKIGGKKTGFASGFAPGFAPGFAIGQAILDWRDPDHRRRRKGAEDRDYADLGKPYGARDGLFESTAELQQVKGVGSALYRRLEPLFTVDCRNAGIDPMVASRAVLAAVPDLDQGELKAFLKARELIRNRADLEAVERLAAGLGRKQKYFEISRQSAFTITARAQSANGIRVVWQALVHISGDPARPFHIRDWRKGNDDFTGNLDKSKKIP